MLYLLLRLLKTLVFRIKSRKHMFINVSLYGKRAFNEEKDMDTNEKMTSGAKVKICGDNKNFMIKRKCKITTNINKYKIDSKITLNYRFLI